MSAPVITNEQRVRAGMLAALIERGVELHDIEMRDVATLLTLLSQQPGRKPSETPAARAERKRRSRLVRQSHPGHTHVTPDVTPMSHPPVTPNVTPLIEWAQSEATQGFVNRATNSVTPDVTPLEGGKGGVTGVVLSVVGSTNGKSLNGNGNHGNNGKLTRLSNGMAKQAEDIRSHLAEVMADVASGSRRKLDAKELRLLQAEFVFSYWQAKMGKVRTMYSQAHESRLFNRLTENKGDVSELLYAIDGCSRSKWHMGENPDRTKYNGIEHIFRDRLQVEKFAEMVPAYGQGTEHPTLTEFTSKLTQDNSKEA